MANFHYFHPADNVAPNATVTAQTGTANASYPLARAVDLTYAHLAQPSKLAETSGAWQFDFGGAQRVDAIVVWHNFDAAIACAFQLHASASWGAPTVNATLTAPAKRADNFTVKIYKDLTGVSGYSAGGFRYGRLVVTGTNSVPIGIKVLLFSRIRQTARNFLWGASGGFAMDEHQTAIDMTTDALAPWAYDLTAAPRLFSAQLSGRSGDEVLIQDWFRACAGRVKPFVIVPDPAVNDAWLCRWSSGTVGVVSPSLSVLTLDGPRHFTHANPRTLVAEEITAGDPEWL